MHQSRSPSPYFLKQCLWCCLFKLNAAAFILTTSCFGCVWSGTESGICSKIFSWPKTSWRTSTSPGEPGIFSENYQNLQPPFCSHCGCNSGVWVDLDPAVNMQQVINRESSGIEIVPFTSSAMNRKLVCFILCVRLEGWNCGTLQTAV